MRNRTKIPAIGCAIALVFGGGIVTGRATAPDHTTVAAAQATAPAVVVPATTAPVLVIPTTTAPTPTDTPATTDPTQPDPDATTDGPAPNDGSAPPVFAHPLPAFPVKQDYCKLFPATNVGLWVRLNQTDVSGVSDGYQMFPFYERGGSQFRDDGYSITSTVPSPVPGQPFAWSIKPDVTVLATVAVTIAPSDGSDHKPSAPFRVPAGQTRIPGPAATFELMVCGHSSNPDYNH